MVGWDKNATEATNATSRDRLMVASHYNFTIFPTLMALIVCVIFVEVATPLITISLLLLLSNPPSQTLNTLIPKNLPMIKTPTYHRSL
jgi:hypothetical protein